MRIRTLAVALVLLAACGKKENPAVPAGGPAPAASDAALATVCDSLPPFDETPPSPDAVVLTEDDWRQLEFVSERQRPFLGRALAEYLAYREAHRQGSGYGSVYARPETFPSLETLGLPAASLGSPLAPLVMSGKTVRGGFALRDPSGAYLYGNANDAGAIVHMGLAWPPAGEPGAAFKTVVSSAMVHGGLFLVDWRQGTVIDAIR